MLGGNPILFMFLDFCSCLVINNSSSLWLDVVLCFNQCLCQVEPLGRLGWSLYDLAVKNRNFALTRLAVTFYWRVLLGRLFLQRINRQITQVHQFIWEFFEFQKYTFGTDYYRLFCFWQSFFSMCCLLILMNLWVVSEGMNHREVGI